MDKLSIDGVVSTNVVLRVHKNPSEEKHAQTTKKDSQIAECTVVLKGGVVVHTSERSEDMYASIDLVSHKLSQKLRRHKEKLQSKRKNEKVGYNKPAHRQGNELESFIEHNNSSVTCISPSAHD